MWHLFIQVLSQREQFVQEPTRASSPFLFTSPLIECCTEMSYAKPSLINAHGLHDASLLQMMTKTMASEETAVAVDSLSIDDSSARRVAHYRQCSLAQRMTMHHQHQSPSTTGHYLTAFGRQTSRFSRGYRRFISRAPLTNRHRINCRNRLLLPLFRYSTFHILAFLSILLLHSTPPISCLDSFNDLGKSTVSSKHSGRRQPFALLCAPLLINL